MVGLTHCILLPCAEMESSNEITVGVCDRKVTFRVSGNGSDFEAVGFMEPIPALVPAMTLKGAA